jgi:hypothetical protein
MISLLENLVEIIGYFPDYILYAIETVANLFFSAVESLFELITTLIPLPAAPAAPEYISTINWFFPIGAIVTIMTPLVAAYASFLAIRWVYAKVGEL